MAVFHRLYEQALALRSKLDQKREAVKQEELESIQVRQQHTVICIVACFSCCVGLKPCTACDQQQQQQGMEAAEDLRRAVIHSSSTSALSSVRRASSSGATTSSRPAITKLLLASQPPSTAAAAVHLADCTPLILASSFALACCQANKTSMSWISSEMMRDRSSGPFENYGEMLYAESLEAMQRKREKVRVLLHNMCILSKRSTLSNCRWQSNSLHKVTCTDRLGKLHSSHHNDQTAS
jgi:hypothetical protein